MTPDPEGHGALKEHEKLLAFLLLVAAIIGLTVVATSLGSEDRNPATDIVFAAKLRIMDIAIGGLLTITGMAAQALFRVSSVDKLSAATALEAARKLPKPTPLTPTKVEIEQPADKPVPTTTDAIDELPDYARP